MSRDWIAHELKFFFSFLLNKNPKEPLNLEDEGAKSHKSWRITSKLTPYTHPQTKRGTLSPRRVFSSSKARILKRAQKGKKNSGWIPNPRSLSVLIGCKENVLHPHLFPKLRFMVRLWFKIMTEINGWFQSGQQTTDVLSCLQVIHFQHTQAAKNPSNTFFLLSQMLHAQNKRFYKSDNDTSALYHTDCSHF